MRKRVTARDVAEAAGVTATTVSYVLNNVPNQTISPETRQRVLQAAKALKYVPNVAARSLRSRQSLCVGVVLKKNLTHPRFNQMLQGIQQTLNANGYNLMLCGAHKKTESGYPDYLHIYLEQRIDGILFLAEENHPPDAAAKQCILENHIPFVAFDCQEQAPGYSTVDLDYEESAFTVAQTMLSRCRKTLFYVRPTLSNAQESKREAGVRRAAAQFPQKQLIVGKMPASYQSTDEADQLLRGCPNASMQNPSLRPAFFKEVETLLLPMMECLEPGDAILSSWATWTRFLRWLRRDVPLITGELANNGEDFSGGDIYARMPNFQAGQCCAQLLLRALAGNAPESRVLSIPCMERDRSLDWLFIP